MNNNTNGDGTGMIDESEMIPVQFMAPMVNQRVAIMMGCPEVSYTNPAIWTSCPLR